MIIRDFYCPDCGSVFRDLCAGSLNVLEMKVFCDRCNQRRMVKTVCNGGTKNRYRMNDFPSFRSNPDFYDGQTSSTVEAYTVDDFGVEHPVEYCGDAGSGVIHDQGVFAPDASAERRDKVKHAFRQKAGKNKLYRI